MKGFIFYAHADRRHFAQFLTHLRAIERGYPITFWSDDRIDPADVFVLLVSPTSSAGGAAGPLHPAYAGRGRSGADAFNDR